MSALGTVKYALEKVTRYFLLVFVFSLPVSSFVSTRILVFTFCFAIAIMVIEKQKPQFIANSWNIIFYLLMLVMGLIYTDDISTGFKVLETSFSLVAMFVVINPMTISNKMIHQMFTAFILGLLVAGVVCLGNAIFNYLQSHDLNVFFYYQLTSPIGSHPTYLAYYLIASITYLIYIAFYELFDIKKIIWLPICAFFFLILMLTGGRTAYISLLLIFSFFTLKYLLEERSKNKTFVFFVVMLMLTGVFGFNSLSYFNSEIVTQGDYWERSQLWSSALEANPSAIIGVGTGDYKSVLNDYYQSHGMARFAADSYNSHNQFIQIYFSNGIVGLLALLLLIGRPLYLSVTSQNALGILLVFPFIIYGITEVFLGRYQGVVFFALVHQVVLFQYFSSRPSIRLSTS